MPELPEVETIRSDLNNLIISNRISDFSVLDFKNIWPDKKTLKSKLKNLVIKKIDRKGKLLIFYFSNSSLILIIHLKMTGQLIYQDKNHLLAGGHSLASQSFFQSIGGKLPNKHTRAIFSFSSFKKLYFNDIRKFGYIKLITKNDLEGLLKKFYGPEPLSDDFNVLYLKKIFKNKKTSIKALLLDQSKISGLGNIYVDEVLFIAKILPYRKPESLNDSEIKKLYNAINKVIKKAIKYRGTTFSNYLDSSGKKGNYYNLLKVYDRKDKLCLNCKKEKVRKVRLVGRGTYYCLSCQS